MTTLFQWFNEFPEEDRHKIALAVDVWMGQKAAKENEELLSSTRGMSCPVKREEGAK